MATIGDVVWRKRLAGLVRLSWGEGKTMTTDQHNNEEKGSLIGC